MLVGAGGPGWMSALIRVSSHMLLVSFKIMSSRVRVMKVLKEVTTEVQLSEADGVVPNCVNYSKSSPQVVK